MSPKIVVLGCGWAGLNFVKSLKGDLDVTVVNPVEYFTFNPLLPCVVGGSISNINVRTELRTVVPSFCKLRIDEALSVDSKAKKIKLASGADLSYDYLIHAVGTTVNTFGIKGVDEFAYPLKESVDADALRAKVESSVNAARVERDSAKRREMLHFVVVGAGPTGVETAAEIGDYILATKDNNIISDSTITLLEMSNKVLPMFSEQVQELTADHLASKFPKGLINVLKESALTSMDATSIKVAMKNPLTKYNVPFLTEQAEGKTLVSLPTSTVVWASGVTQKPITKELMAEQVNNDPTLGSAPALRVHADNRAIGMDGVYAIGDVSFCIPKPLTADILSGSKHSTVEQHLLTLKDSYPQIPKKFTSKTPLSDTAGVVALLNSINKSYRSPPPTAQVAAQHGKYLGKILSSQLAKSATVRSDLPAFHFNNKGALCYVGLNRAVGSFPNGFDIKPKVPFTGMFWRAVYTDLQFSVAMKVKVASDFTKNSLRALL